jgi:hypothetical protein
MTVSISGIYLSAYNYNSGRALEWAENFGNYGDSDNRGVLKVWKLGKANLAWATFQITGQSSYLNRGTADGIHICLPVQAFNSQDYFLHEGNFPESGEMALTVNHAGPTGQAGAGGGGGGAGGSPATGYSGSYQIHAPYKHEEGGAFNPMGTLTGSELVFEGWQHNVGNDTWTPTNQLGIGTNFYVDSQDPVAMTGILDVRGDIGVKGFVCPIDTESYNLGGRFNRWDYLHAVNAHFTNGMDDPVYGSQVTVGGTLSGLLITGDVMQTPSLYANYIETDYIAPYGNQYSFDPDYWMAVIIGGNLIPDGGSFWDLGSYNYPWQSLYASSSTIHMSGGTMTGWGKIGLNDDGDLVVTSPGPTGLIIEPHSGVVITGVNANTVPFLNLSGVGATGNTVLSTTSEGGIKIQVPGQTGDEGSTVATGSSSTEISSPSGTFSSGIDAGGGTIAIDESGLNFCGAFQECIEDLGEWTDTGHNAFRTGYAIDRLEISFTGRSLKTLELKYHATGLRIRDAEAGRTMAIRVSGGSPIGGYSDITAYRFLSGNNLNFLGVEPVALKIGKVGLLSITAFGTGDTSCFATWAETDYTAL